MFYSTPSQYLAAIKDTESQWPVKNDGDFFPYGSEIFSYWTGYYTSRPTLKYNERVASNFLQVIFSLLFYNKPKKTFTDDEANYSNGRE